MKPFRFSYKWLESLKPIPCGYTQTQDGDDMLYHGEVTNELQAYYVRQYGLLIYTINYEEIFFVDSWDVKSIHDEIKDDFDYIVPNMLGIACDIYSSIIDVPYKTT